MTAVENAAPDGLAGTSAPSERPRLADDVSLHPPADDGGRWVVQCGAKRYFRTDPDAAALLARLDGSLTRSELLAELGAPWSADHLSRALASFTELGLLADGAERRSEHRRLVFRPPFTVQITLCDPGRILARARPALARLGGPAPKAAAVLGVAGVFALAWQADRIDAVLSSPFSLGDYVAVLAVFYAVILLHELGHGAVLAYHGGRPTRLGVMLFYLSPAFFCDVSDGWRLPRREQRVAVALAGITTQCAVAGLLGLISLFTADARAELLLVAFLLYVYGLFNLVPFVKLDGYIAFMSHLDVSHLRAHAMTDARRLLARVLFGGSYPRKLPQFRWSAAYGLACMLFPVYLIATVLTTWLNSLVMLGLPGSLLGLGAVAYCLYWAFRALRRLIAEARAAGARMIRFVPGSLALIAAAGILLLSIHIPYQVRAGYVYDNGAVRLALTAGGDPAAAQPGRTVVLESGGIALRHTLGTATVTGAAGSPGRVSIQTLVPLRSDGLTIPATEYPLAGLHADHLDSAGPAVIEISKVPLGKWLVQTYVAPELRAIFPWRF